MTDELYKIDIIRERLGVSYKEAQEALNQAGGDVVAAIVNLESQAGFGEDFEERKEKVVNQIQSIIKRKCKQDKVKKEVKWLLRYLWPWVFGCCGHGSQPAFCSPGRFGQYSSNV